MHRIPHFDNFWKFITNISFIISLIIPLWILIYGIRNKVTQIKWKGIFLCITWVLGTIVNVIIKFSVDRERPFYEYPKLVEKLSTGGSPSFPSGHTAEAVSVAIAILLVYSHRKLSSTVVIIWALMVAYSRMCLGVHFPSDVLAGIGIGIFSAGLSLYITERIAKQRI